MNQQIIMLIDEDAERIVGQTIEILQLIDTMTMLYSNGDVQLEQDRRNFIFGIRYLAQRAFNELEPVVLNYRIGTPIEQTQ